MVEVEASKQGHLMPVLVDSFVPENGHLVPPPRSFIRTHYLTACCLR
jgi:hypothetical protein